MKKTLLLLILPVLLFSCKEKKEDMLSKKWKAVSVENPQLDSIIHEQEVFLDTFGRNADAATNQMIYGISNIDSARESLKAQLKDMRSMQEHSVLTTVFDFKKNGTVIMNFSGQSDSTKWYFDKDGKLVLDEPKLKGSGETIKMDVIQLTANDLKLKFTQDGMASTVTFKPDNK